MRDGMQTNRLHSPSLHYPLWMPKTTHHCAVTFVMLYLVNRLVICDVGLYRMYKLKVSGTATFEPTNITARASGMAAVMLRKTST